jgi:hypothetical protein
MAKDVLRLSGDYAIETNPNGTITLNTGNEQGTVVVTGDLTVLGNTSTVSSENLTIKDNIIVLNQGETNNGVTLGTSGIQIDRGTANADATILWDDNEPYTMPSGSAGAGMFKFRVGSTLGAIQAHHVSTTGDDLVLLGNKAPNAKVSIRGTTDYELNLEDDDLVNKKYVDDAIQGGVQIPVIRSDNTKVETYDIQSGDPRSQITGEVDGVVRLLLTNQEITLGDITVDGTTIRPTNSNSSLFLESNGSAEVVVKDVLSITGNVAPSAPTDDAYRLKLYVQTEDVGGSGLFFVNTSSTRDELVSKKKAILMSMLF